MSFLKSVFTDTHDNINSPTDERIKYSVIKKILKEYSLKKNKFHPNSPSPNRFNNRLFLRMKKYYSLLYKEDNDNIK
jgi:hypothetical protein